MRMSRQFGRTLRQIPAEAETPSHQLLLRAGYISQLAAGVYSFLPSAYRVIRKIEEIVRQEMNAAGGQEVHLPAMQPLELWQESGRDAAMGDVLFRLQDRRERPLVLGPTHEEVVTDLVRRTVQSYRELPLVLYQIQTKFRDEPRPRGGLVRVREFTMKDAYSFDADAEGLEKSYRAMAAAYSKIFARCGIETVAVEADSGAIGGKDSMEFVAKTESGEDSVLVCSNNDYAANAERAEFAKVAGIIGDLLPIEEVSTPGIKSIENLAAFLHIGPEQTLKVVFYVADGGLIVAVLRGDQDVNEIKLSNTLKARNLRLATSDEVGAAGIVAGFASPAGLQGVRVVADDSIKLGSNFVAGANKPDTHLRNVNYPRDFSVDVIADIALARGGEQCLRCGGTLEAFRAVELGHVFKLGTVYSSKMDAVYLDQDGTQRQMLMGCYGIGIDRLMATVVELCHDEKGMLWPVSIAPYQVHLVGLGLDDPAVAEAAGQLYTDLQRAGYEVLYDDRPETAGVKFNDADLVGMPVRITVSKRTVGKSSAEVKKRSESTFETVALTGVLAHINAIFAGHEFIRVA